MGDSPCFESGISVQVWISGGGGGEVLCIHHVEWAQCRMDTPSSLTLQFSHTNPTWKETLTLFHILFLNFSTYIHSLCIHTNTLTHPIHIYLYIHTNTNRHIYRDTTIHTIISITVQARNLTEYSTE